MSSWATIEASFVGSHLTEEVVRDGLPTGSETGPGVWVEDRSAEVVGRLRDVSDLDSPAVLAWFIQVAERGVCDHASLLFEIDGGPRYRYALEGGQLLKLRGVLDG